VSPTRAIRCRAVGIGKNQLVKRIQSPRPIYIRERIGAIYPPTACTVIENASPP
jgi:hypothetical protein